MKVIICVLAIAVAAGALTPEQTFVDSVHKFYNKFIAQLPCGFSESGPLDPFVISKKQIASPISISEEGLK